MRMFRFARSRYQVTRSSTTIDASTCDDVLSTSRDFFIDSQVTRLHSGDTLRLMSRRERAARPFLPEPTPEIYKKPGRAIGAAAVPVAPSFLDLEQEDTVAYDSAVSLPALLAESRRSVVASEEAPQAPPPVLATTTSEIRPRTDSLHVPPHAEETQRLPSAPRLELVHSQPRASAFPYSESLPPALVQPRARRRRSPLARAMLFVLTLGAVLFVAFQLAVASKIPELDPRPLLSKSIESVKSKIPWDHLPRLPNQ
jgi:hypothetical protein